MASSPSPSTSTSITDTDTDTTSISSPSPSPKAPLLTIPLELRLEIYSYLLSLPPYYKYEYRPSHVHPNLLLANRQINWEATPLLYASNTFLAHPTLLASFPRLRAWYMPIRVESVVPRIRRFHIQVQLDCDVPYDRRDVARAFSGIDELTIDLVQSMFMGSGYTNLRRFEAVRGVHRVTILGSTTGFDEYIAWLQKAMTSDPGAAIDDFHPLHPNWADHLTLAC
ncbi:hypothetical protein B0I35DRAFT_432704 [Stachybotrys elegans]|uniref:Uncharacterized protein n=1 Tax=Stachybotrys elegans TaxID=80388 RepID=A0A8K0ST38_9HYPO|nr:hypothetical protein B0I35DRAFT_432704 [Stachybotrys elegans]